MRLAAVGMLREARLAEGAGLRAVAGAGRADLLEHRLRAVLTAGGLSGVVSLGVAGALDPDLQVGDLVIGAEAIGAEVRLETSRDWTQELCERLPGARLAPVFGARAMILHAADKARLRVETGAAIVDMESAVAARLAAAHGLPFAILRAVSDEAETSLPPAVLNGLKPDGSMDLAGVLAALARRPGQLPALMRTGRDAEVAFKVLGRAVEALR